MDVDRLVAAVLEAERARYVALLKAYAEALAEIAQLRAAAAATPEEP